MEQNTSKRPASSLEYSKMLFLVSHGLQSPLSSIRWGCGRLRRTGDNLTEQQKELLTGVQREARILSHMFDWMLLLAKLEEGVYKPSVQDVYVNDYLVATIAGESLLHTLQVTISCPEDLQIQIDRTVFDALMRSLLLTLAVSSDIETPAVNITADQKSVSVSIEAPLTLSLLQDDQDASGRKIVGGVPGCLLSMASSFAQALNGHVTPTKGEAGIERLTVRLPLHPTLSSLIR